MTIVAAVVLLSAPAYGATWTTQTTLSGPADGDELTSVSSRVRLIVHGRRG